MMISPTARLARNAALLLILTGLAALPLASVPAASPDRRAAESVAVARAQHLTELGVDRWLAAGVSARGIKIAILDSGLHGYREFLGKTLPAKVTVHSFRKDGNLEARSSQHGLLCAEVVHTLAPDADLLLANWDQDDAASFLQAVRWAREQGARIISCSVIMPRYSDGQGGGPTHEALARLLGTGTHPGDMLLFASAGNTAQRTWSGTFHPNAAGFHEWQPGVDENLLSPWGDEHVSVELTCKPGSNYELLVKDAASGAEVARSKASAIAGSAARIASFEPQDGHSYRVRLRLVDGKPGPFHVVALYSGLSIANQAGSVAFPADGPEVVAVGAVDHQGRRTYYSACGSAEFKSKPDLVAPVPFTSSWRPQPFAGTSAAAPQAAAVAALLWSRTPDWAAEHVRTALRQSAKDLGPPGYDPETGFGLIHLPVAPAGRVAGKP